MEKVKVSIILPVYNEERYIGKCIESLLLQDYHQNKMEVIFIDGNSRDNTLNIIKSYGHRFNNIRIFENHKKTVPHAMNMGIDSAQGEYIVRMDVHSLYEKDYISKCVELLEATGADNVGGHAAAEGVNHIGRAVSFIQTCPFGTGGSRFRNTDFEGYVDTVFLGAFKKSTLLSVGKYNSKLTRNQDIELNSRIRKKGGRIYLSSKIKCKYFCRDSIKGFIKQSFENGKWNIYTTKINKEALSLRHYIPFLFFTSITVLFLLSLIKVYGAAQILLLELVTYLIIDGFFTIGIALKRGLKYLFTLFILFPILHISYGAGSFFGLLTVYNFEV